MSELISTWAKMGGMAPLAASTWRVTLVDGTAVNVEANDVANPASGAVIFVDRKGRLIKLFPAGQYLRVDILSEPEIYNAY